jgi:hypothetical protein
VQASLHRRPEIEGSQSFSAETLSGQASRKSGVTKRVSNLSSEATPVGVGVETLSGGPAADPFSW